jgi:hypothetical protein
MRDCQVTKDFLESVHEILNEWHLIEFVLRNVMVLIRINLFVFKFGTRRKLKQRGTFIPPCEYIVGKFRKKDLSRFASMKSLPPKEQVKRPMSLPIEGAANYCAWMNV